MDKPIIFWETYLNLENELIELSKSIFFTDVKTIKGKDGYVEQPCNSQLETFSPLLCDLLVQTCVQIEAVSKELYFESGGEKNRGDSNLFFDEDCLKLIDKKWQTHNKVVLVTSHYCNFVKDENYVLKPLREAHKRKGTCWERAYQGVKHDRYNSMPMGNVKVLIHAMAALFLLNMYYRKVSLITSVNSIMDSDYSFGSRFFSVKAPTIGQLWYDNKPLNSTSPLIAKYKDADFERIKEIQESENIAANNYWKAQPELEEADFLKQLNESIELGKDDPGLRLMRFWELGKYRLRKKVPKSLPFEKRKELLIQSEEWNGWIHQHNKHIPEDDLTEDNIDEEITHTGTEWGIELEQRFRPNEWLPIAINNKNVKVYIPD